MQGATKKVYTMLFPKRFPRNPFKYRILLQIQNIVIFGLCMNRL